MRWNLLAKTGGETPGIPPQPGLLGLEDNRHFSAIRRARRILVLGSSGAGKTHFSARLSRILGLGLIHLDKHFWQPGAKPRGDREWRGIVSKLVQRDSWIMDGTYERSLDLRIPRADAIVMIECPRSRCLEQVLDREKKSARRQRPDLAPGCAEQVDLNHVRYVLQYPEKTRPKILEGIARYGHDTPVAAIEGPDAFAPFVSTLQSPVAA